jgi:hypothetical protein
MRFKKLQQIKKLSKKSKFDINNEERNDDFNTLRHKGKANLMTIKNRKKFI